MKRLLLTSVVFLAIASASMAQTSAPKVTTKTKTPKVNAVMNRPTTELDKKKTETAQKNANAAAASPRALTVRSEAARKKPVAPKN